MKYLVPLALSAVVVGLVYSTRKKSGGGGKLLTPEESKKVTDQIAAASKPPPAGGTPVGAAPQDPAPYITAANALIGGAQADPIAFSAAPFMALADALDKIGQPAKAIELRTWVLELPRLQFEQVARMMPRNAGTSAPTGGALDPNALAYIRKVNPEFYERLTHPLEGVPVDPNDPFAQLRKMNPSLYGSLKRK